MSEAMRKVQKQIEQGKDTEWENTHIQIHLVKDLVEQAQQDREFLKVLQSDMLEDVNNTTDLKVSATKLAMYVGRIGNYLE